MEVDIVRSGSKGNATLIYSNGHVLLIDMGISLKCLKDALSIRNLKLINIEAMLLTHEHSDHTKSIKYLFPLPVYTTKGTYDGSNVNEIKLYKEFELLGFKITPIPVSHDAHNPVGFVIEDNKDKLVYITDTGMILPETEKYLKDATYYVFESNHDLKMLRKTNRPASLKLRIASDIGHLSNEDSAHYLAGFIGEHTKVIVLAHISLEANTPELVLKAYKKVFQKYNIDLDKIELKCSSQSEIVRI